MYPAAVDVVVDGELVAGKSTIEGTIIGIATDGSLSFEQGPPSTTLRFDDLPPGTKQLEVWLPNAGVTLLRAVRIDDGASATAPPADTRRRWIHYGSSISHCLEADRPTGVWPVVAARKADVALDSFGLAGQCQLDQLVARTIRDMPADLISMKVGINLVNGDTMRERTFVPAVHGFLDTVRDGHPDTPIVIVSPILCPVHEDHPGPTAAFGGSRIAAIERSPELSVGALTLQRIRALLADVVATRRSQGDEHLHLIDGRELFGEADLADLPDGLHPNSAGYARMGERFHALGLRGRRPLRVVGDSSAHWRRAPRGHKLVRRPRWTSHPPDTDHDAEGGAAHAHDLVAWALEVLVVRQLTDQVGGVRSGRRQEPAPDVGGVGQTGGQQTPADQRVPIAHRAQQDAGGGVVGLALRPEALGLDWGDEEGHPRGGSNGPGDDSSSVHRAILAVRRAACATRPRSSRPRAARRRCRGRRGGR